MKNIFVFLTAIALLSCVSAKKSADQATLVITEGKTERRFTRAELLASPHLKEITVAKDPAYGGKQMVYQAVPAAPLFDGVVLDKDSTLVFRCLDGFSAPISAARVLNRDVNGSIAYIAVEKNQWPPLKKGSPATAGPFYLIWENPEKSKIVTEEWPFQLSSFEIKPSFEKQFPNTVPAASAQAPVHKGYRSFQQNCFACHTLNGDGTSQLGPDLNLPHNPTEYMKDEFLAKLIRDPQSLRHWPQSKMAAMPALSDEEIKNIVQYLKHMSSRKKPAAKKT